MARSRQCPLDAGTAFPALDLTLVDGTSLSLPADLDDRWGIILLYRGHW